MQVIERTVKWTGMEAANKVIQPIKGINAWLVQTYRPEKTKHDIAWNSPLSRLVLVHEQRRQKQM